MDDPKEMGESTEESALAEMVVTAGDPADEEPEATVEDETEAEDQEADQEPNEIESLRTDLEKKFEDFKRVAENEKADLQKEVNRLGYALRKAEKDGAKETEPAFTDAQLLQMMKDHQDEPEVMFQIMKEMTRQSGEAVEKSAEAKVKIESTRKGLREAANRSFPGSLEEGSPVYADIQKTKASLGLESNPYGDELSLAIMTLDNLPRLMDGIREQTKKELLGQTADDKRKGKIKTNALADKGHKQSEKVAHLTEGANETAKRLGMNERQLKRYRKIMEAAKKGGGAIQAAI
jgi:hypothetical protein